MSSAALLAIWSSVVLAMAGSFFGVCLARLLWAEDLKFAKHIDEIRSRTAVARESIIKTQAETIAILKHRLGEH